MTRPLLFIRVTINRFGQPQEDWGTEVPCPSPATPEKIKEEIDARFARLREQVKEILQ